MAPSDVVAVDRERHGRTGSLTVTGLRNPTGTRRRRRSTGRQATLLIVADAVVSQTLDLLLDGGPATVVRYANSGAEAQAVAAECLPDIVLLDVRLPDMLAPRAIKLVRVAAPSARIVALGRRVDHAALAKALTAGADGCLIKDACDAVIVEALWGSFGAGRPAAPDRRKAERAVSTPNGQRLLSAREREVLRLVAAGRTNREIAEATGVSIDRVRACVRSAFRKLGVRNRVEATRKLSRGTGQLNASPHPSGAETAHDAAEVPQLSPREEEVLGHMATGRTNPEIADLTGLSPETVKAYLKSAFGKLGVRNRVEATRALSKSARPAGVGVKRTPKRSPLTEAAVALTPGEVEVVREMATGKTNGEIAQATGLSRNTVKTYLQIVFRKLEVRNRIEAMAKAEESGLLG